MLVLSRVEMDVMSLTLVGVVSTGGRDRSGSVFEWVRISLGAGAGHP